MEGIDLKRFGPDDRDWLVAQHSDHYAREEGFDATFGVLVAQIADDFLSNHDPVREAGWIAWRGGVRLGSIFCVGLDHTTAKLRLFLLVPEARGTGLGKRMLAHNMAFARDAGYRAMQLWTHESHSAAGALYARTGWTLGESRTVQSFGRTNVEQTWRITL
ncbi:GNAT family N-acetyltransferase [Sulfitobacter sp. JB4-11]|uniref:GNAT family N-acetyltransferase n=1 Tax=Sulfitobacter rhodophyticola TaxID=3238304 RepID=UPI0035180F85